MRTFSWLTTNDETDEDGFYLQGEAAYNAERAELLRMGAPDTEHIRFLSVEPEDRDSAMVTAEVTERFVAWAKTNPETGEEVTEDENGDSNVVFYER